MKKVSIISVILLWGVISVSAQVILYTPKPPQIPKMPRIWFGIQVAQSFGLNDWNRVKFASDRLPGTAATELRGTLNVTIVRPIGMGIFHDIGMSILPSPRNGYSDPAPQATLSLGTPFHTKDIRADNGYQTATAHFNTTFGLFWNNSVSPKFSIAPCLGVGLMTMTAPDCSAIIKEQDSNMQYIAHYRWFDSMEEPVIGRLAGRLRFAYYLAPRRYLLFGIEYTWNFTRVDFSETYTNYFNYNLIKTNTYKGHRLNTLGLSLGVSF